MGDTTANLSISAVEIYNASAVNLGLGVISPNTEWLKSGEFAVYLLLTDAALANLICQQKGFGARKTFLTGTQAGIANGAQLSSMVGPVESIQFVVTGGRWDGIHPGTPPIPGSDDLASQLARLQIENRNVTLNPEIAPHYIQDGTTIWHNGAGLVLGGAAAVAVNATFCVFTYNQAAASVQCPSEWSRATVLGALAMAISKDGHKTQAAAAFRVMFEDEKAALGLGAGGGGS